MSALEADLFSALHLSTREAKRAIKRRQKRSGSSGAGWVAASGAAATTPPLSLSELPQRIGAATAIGAAS